MAKRKIRYADIYEEGTAEYERLHVDPEALNQLFEILKRIRKSKGFLGPQYAWYDNECPTMKVRLEHNPSQVDSDRQALERAANARDILKPAEDVAYRIYELIRDQAKACERDIESYRRRRGFFLLPDEILSTVLEYAALPRLRDESARANFSIRRVKAATKLSHVCKRFRSLITHSSTYWQNISDDMKNAHMVSTCLSRCRRANAEICLTITFFPKRGHSYVEAHENTPFIKAITEGRKNWRSFALDSYTRRLDVDTSDLEEFDAKQLREFSDLATGLDLPHLSTLSIRFPRIVQSTTMQVEHNFCAKRHFYSTWDTPRLQSASFYNLVPVPFSGTFTLVSLTVDLDLSRHFYHDKESKFDPKSLVSFLADCPLLLQLSLSVCRAEGTNLQTQSLRSVEMSHVSTLDVRLSDCHVRPIESLFSALNFPQVSNMRLSISSDGDEREPGMRFTDIFRAVIPDADAFPKLIDISLDVHCKTNFEVTPEDRIRIPGSASIPLDVMPHLKSLELDTYTTMIQPIPETMPLPALRTLVLKNCHELEKDWLARLLRHSVGQGNLDLLRVSILGFCASLRESGIEGTLTKEDILKTVA